MANYIPPKQSKLSQLFDVAVLIAMTFGALYIPLYMGLAGGAKVAADPAKLTWAAIGKSPTEIAQYNALGITDPAAVPAIFARYDYTISIVALLAMIVIIVAYYALMLKFSETEYREVIAEKFDK